MERKDFLPGAVITDAFTPESNCAKNSRMSVWADRGKLFLRISVEGDHPEQVEIDIANKTFDVYGHD